MKIILFEPNPDISTNPTLINLIRRFSDDGIQIDIFQPNHGIFLPLDITKKNVNICHYNYCSTKKCTGLTRLSYWIQKLRVFYRLKSENKVIVIAVDPNGLVEAYQYCRWMDVPLVYLSFEMFFMEELTSVQEQKNKEIELQACQKVALTIIQDPLRGRLLKEENRLADMEMFYLPVAPSNDPAVKKTDYLRDKFNIPEEKIIVTHAGSFSEWTCAEELIESSKSWPEEFVLVIHIRNQPNEFIKTLMLDKNTAHIIFSTDPCTESEYEELLASADIGLVLYKPTKSNKYTGKNIENMGLSSGKFSSYMKCGIPIISINQEYYKKMLKSYEFGLDIDDFKAMPEALFKIKENYNDYCNGVKRLFEERLNFDLYYEDLKNKLFEMVSKDY